MSRARAVLLLSGGLDSAYNLYAAPKDYDVVLAITFDYGQRAAEREIISSSKLCEHLGVEHRIIHLPWFKEFTSTGLVNRESEIPVGGDVQIDAELRSQETAKAVWVPNRNGIFLNIAAAFAEGLGAEIVLAGFNLEEAQTFPDNSQEYLDAATEALRFSTANHVKVQSYCANLTKTEIVKRAQELRLPFTQIWPCYFSNEDWCGQCESCQRFARAVRDANFVGQDFDLSSPI